MASEAIDWTWERVWNHVKSQRPALRAVPPLGPPQADGGRLVLVRQQGAAKAGDLRPALVYLDANGDFIDVAREDSMSGRVELVDGRVIDGGER